MYKFFTLILFLLPLGCLAQFTITGKLLNQDDKKPVANASVFLDNATIGNASANNGSFILTGVPSGKYTLVVSIIGFETFTETVIVNRKNIKMDDIYLTPKTHALKEVFVKPDPFRDNNIYMFKEEFIGKSELADQCKILNPEVLTISYDKSTNTLSASSDGFLDIENDGLGYKIRYLLADFQYCDRVDSPKLKYRGSVLYESLKGSPAQQRRWEKARQDVYANSAMHFYRALIGDRLTQEGFKMQQYAYVPNPERRPDTLIAARIAHYQELVTISNGGEGAVNELKYWKKIQKQNNSLPRMVRKLYSYQMNQQDIVSLTDQPGIYAIGCDTDQLFILYDKNGHFDRNFNINHINNSELHYTHSTASNTVATLITFLSTYAFIDRNGIIIDPYDIFYTGAWGNMREADLLPSDYEVPEAVEQVPVDSTVLKNITAKMQNYALKHAIEKAYLHFDKPYYAAGDTMYFKAYVTIGGRHILSGLSGVLHVDLVNSDNVVAQSLNLQLADGVAWGDFALPDSMSKTNYHIRAYTQWMRNESHPQFFEKAIPVGGKAGISIPAGAVKPPTASAGPDVQFLPEGGRLVTGLNSKVAFKAVDHNGLGINIKGEVIDNDGHQLCTFSSAHLGMGYFSLQPKEGKTYKAKITYANGTTATFDLPLADNSGIALSVGMNDSTQMALINITANKSAYQQNHNKDYTLVIYSGGSLTNFICKLDSPTITVDIFKRVLRTGIARITVFSPTGEPLCERQLFIQNYDGLKLDVKSDKTSYTKREKVNIKLNAVDDDGAPAPGHFSVAVTDEGKVPVDESNENTIMTNLLLTSDLKGYVEQPNYYFLPKNTDAASNLDLLMLTQGYRGFEWKEVLKSDTTTAITYPPENWTQLSGKVTTLAGKPVANGKITLLSTKQNIAMDTTTDKNGNFIFTGINISDTTKLVLHATMKNGNSAVNIKLDKPVYPPVNGLDTDEYKMSDEALAAMKKMYEDNRLSGKAGIVLKQVDVKSAKITHGPQLSHSANLNGPGRADFVLMGDKLQPGCVNLLDCLKGVIPGVMYQNNIIYSMHTHYELNGPRQPMAIIIDGQINEQGAESGEEILQRLDPNSIYSIEVLLNLSYLTIYGSKAAGGAIIITTKTGGEFNNTQTSGNGTVYYTFNGFYKAHTFYSPKYDVAEPVANKPDLRTTIFWNPELVTDKDGNATFDLYNSDGTGTYRVVVEGIDENGNIGRRVYHYSVK